MALAIVVLGFASLFIGAMDVSLAAILNGDLEQLNVLLVSRLPRLLAILCTGVGMSVAGLLMQNLCMNKFVSPSTSSTIAFAQLGVLLALIWFNDASLLEKTAISFVTSIIGTWVFIYFTQKIQFKDIIMVPLIGIMLGNVIGGITTHFAYVYDVMQSLQGALVGDFSLIIKGRYEVVFLVVPLLVVSYWFANHFNIVGLGESFAKNLGVNYNLVLFGGLSIAALLTASIVVTVGAIAYLGLIVPNIVAMFRGDNIRGCLLDVSLFGALFVLICDMFGRLVIFPYELPVTLIAGVIGSVAFLMLMFKRLSPARS
ncbi:iron chelate uptake ABC transporter family permease subunit [Vibrio sp. SM6]|uniref:Iron chelate uptake ABC transporter family permease subunit n=2 Tax=Vibrio agarilyticus TaxID=2726741 RepID=A0A7X8TR29_9VIBR|nr:iron chelate uptake ABC transporter family permease subunit [Vibrio agarilyticus]NLS13204.1 iron chelate uptake ABC transporter family permease subunit [Vibrio agarilyticus]